MTDKAEWEVVPNSAIGPLRLRTTRAELDSAIGEQSERRMAATGYPIELRYSVLGVAVSLDGSGIAREIEVSAPANPTLAGKPLLGVGIGEALRRLTRAGCVGTIRDSHSIDAEACGIRLWLPDGVVASVVVFDIEDKPPKVSTAELLSRLGIKPS